MTHICSACIFIRLWLELASLLGLLMSLGLLKVTRCPLQRSGMCLCMRHAILRVLTVTCGTAGDDDKVMVSLAAASVTRPIARQGTAATNLTLFCSMVRPCLALPSLSERAAGGA